MGLCRGISFLCISFVLLTGCTRKDLPFTEDAADDVARNKVSSVQLLIKAGLDVNSESPSGKKPLEIASERGHEQIVKLLLKEGADPNAKDKRGTPVLTLAVRGHHTQVVAMLLEAGAKPDALDAHKKTALLLACESADVESAKLLIKHGASLSAQDQRGSTVLGILSRAGNEFDPKRSKRVTYLIGLMAEHGADVKTSEGSQALARVLRAGDAEVGRKLLDRGAKLGAANSEALIQAAGHGDLATVRLLLEAGADPNGSGLGGPPLFAAAMSCKSEVVKELLRHGANPSVANSNGALPVLAARHYARQEAFSGPCNDTEALLMK